MDGHCSVIHLDGFHPQLDKPYCKKKNVLTKPQSKPRLKKKKIDINPSILFMGLLLHNDIMLEWIGKYLRQLCAAPSHSDDPDQNHGCVVCCWTFLSKQHHRFIGLTCTYHCWLYCPAAVWVTEHMVLKNGETVEFSLLWFLPSLPTKKCSSSLLHFLSRCWSGQNSPCYHHQRREKKLSWPWFYETLWRKGLGV